MYKHILITIDVEDWFQVENFKQCIPYSSWSSLELRVEKNTHKLLDLLDAKQSEIKATFFVLGWNAKRLPSLIREIHARGHEVASHGYNHNLCTQQSYNELKQDLADSKALLEDIIGSSVFGYRAPSFAIDENTLKVIEDSGYLYDSSYNSFSKHGRYGQVNLPKTETHIIAIPVSDKFYELPISNLQIGKHIIPWGGGGYFRLIHPTLFAKGVKHLLRSQNAYIFYMHPWEIDPEQPKMDNALSWLKFRHYINLPKTEAKLLRFISYFREYQFVTCRQYAELHHLKLSSDPLSCQA